MAAVEVWGAPYGVMRAMGCVWGIPVSEVGSVVLGLMVAILIVLLWGLRVHLAFEVPYGVLAVCLVVGFVIFAPLGDLVASVVFLPVLDQVVSEVKSVLYGACGVRGALWGLDGAVVVLALSLDVLLVGLAIFLCRVLVLLPVLEVFVCLVVFEVGLVVVEALVVVGVWTAVMGLVLLAFVDYAVRMVSLRVAVGAVVIFLAVLLVVALAVWRASGVARW